MVRAMGSSRGTFFGIRMFGLVPGLTVAAMAQDAPPTEPVAGKDGARAVVGDGVADPGGRYQVRVTGGDSLTRVQFNSFVDDYREDFRWLLFKLRINQSEERKRWDLPVSIVLWGSARDVHAGEAVKTTIEIRPDSPHFLIKLDVKLHDRFDEAAFRRELAKAFLIEQMLAPFGSNPDGLKVEQVDPPAWLVDGFDNLISHRRGGSPSSYYRGFFEKGQILKPDDLFRITRPMELDPVAREIYRASASAFVEVLLEQEDGDLGVRALLGDLLQAPGRSLDALLRQHFPAFRELDQGLEKWWALELVALSQQQGFEYLDWKRTEQLLNEALAVEFAATTVAVPVDEKEKPRGLRDLFTAKSTAPPQTREAFSGTLADFEQFLDRPEAKTALKVVFDRLQILKRGGYPLYRPVFSAYERCIERLAKGDKKDLAAEFTAIAELRTKIAETLTRTEDVLNHFEATRAPERSGAFDEYFQTRRLIEQRPRPARKDAITRHLDALEREFR